LLTGWHSPCAGRAKRLRERRTPMRPRSSGAVREARVQPRRRAARAAAVSNAAPPRPLMVRHRAGPRPGGNLMTVQHDLQSVSESFDLDEFGLADLRRRSSAVRSTVLQMISAAGSRHVGSSLSCTDILTSGWTAVPASARTGFQVDAAMACVAGPSLVTLPTCSQSPTSSTHLPVTLRAWPPARSG
jgi:hypothetical protein